MSYRLSPSATALSGGAAPPVDGEAVWRYPDGTVYEGSWRDGLRHGRGVCFFPLSGNVYVGAFNQDKVDGVGSLFYRDGDFFHGEFRDGMCDGSGVFFSNGVEARGEWRQGKRLNDPTSTNTVHNNHDEEISEIRRDLHIKTMSMMMRSLSSHFAFYMGAERLEGDTGASTPGLKSGSVTWGDLGTTNTSPADGPPMMRVDTSKNLLATFQQQIAQEDNNDDVRGEGTYNSEAWLEKPTVSATTTNHQQGEGGSKTAAVRSSMWGRDGISAPPPILAPPTSTSSNVSFIAATASGGGGAPIQHYLPQAEHHPFDRNAVLGGSTETDQGASLAAVAIPISPTVPNSPKRITFVRPATCDPMLLFAVATPSFTEVFNIRKFLKRSLAMLFPFLSLPHLRCSPFKITNNALERELVVSGASVRIRPGVPRTSLYINLVVLVASVVGVCLDRNELVDKAIHDRDVQTVDILSPFTSWFLLAMMCGGYHAYERVAHPLERLDRQGMPSMASFISSTIDSYSQVCVYTWDPLGNIRVSNNHYRYRWLVLSTLLSLVLSMTSPLAARLLLGREPYGTSDYSLASSLVLSFALFLGSSAILYMVFKATDIQRQLLSQLTVLSSLAYVNGSSILRPTTLRNSPFHFDDLDLSVKEKHRGVVGWMITRSYVVYANVVTNHGARASLMVPYTLYLLLISILAIAYWVSVITDDAEACELFGTYHALGAMALLVHGLPLIRYMLVCATIAVENSRHLYLVDLALILHSSKKKSITHQNDANQASLELLKGHREALFTHDYQPNIATIPITPAIILVVTLLMTLGFVSFIYPILLSLICYASHN